MSASTAWRDKADRLDQLQAFGAECLTGKTVSSSWRTTRH